MTSRQIHFIFISLFVICLINIFTSWIFVRFLHYHSQYRILNPNDYNVQILTEDDYRKLSEPSNQEVTLSDGTLVSGRTEIWYSKVLPNYKVVKESGQYVLVTIKGTAPFVQYWEMTVIPLATILILALVFNLAVYRHKKQSIENKL